jgi:hypothetical protein
MLVEVGSDELIVRASAPSAEGKVMGSEPWTKVDGVTIERLAANVQRLEILRRSLIRMAIVGGIALAFFLFLRSFPPHLAILGALAIAAFIGPLNFLLNGGLGRKQDVVRFHFMLAEGGRPFYLEVLPEEEPKLHWALLSVGLGFEDTEAGQ